MFAESAEQPAKRRPSCCRTSSRTTATSKPKARRIQDREHDGDEVTHASIRLLNTTFITPMDREDIYALASALDEVLDAIDAERTSSCSTGSRRRCRR